MITRIVAKKNLQVMLKACRQAGLRVVTQAESMQKYRVFAGDDLVLSAMTGNNGYLVRLKPDLFQVLDMFT